VHPNVDKRSFIRAKQSQIHQERQHRKLQIETLKYERVINDGLLKRISALLAALKSHAAEAAGRNPGEVAFQAVMESAGKPEDDRPPPRPEGVHSDEPEQPTYSKMMAALLDQVNKALDEKKPDDRYKAMVEEVEGHEAKVQDLQRQLLEKLQELEKEERKKITSEGIHTGFDSSHVNKSKSAEPTSGPSSSPSSQPELLNPNFDALQTQKPGNAAKADAIMNDEEEIEASPDAQKFAEIKASNYSASLQFLAQHPHITSERESDGILGMAFNAGLEGNDEKVRQYVHQSIILQYCRLLGRDGVRLFFNKIMNKDPKAQQMFYPEVQDMYMKIKTRTKEIIAEKAKEEEGEGVEQIQLHAVEPGTVIQIQIPPADSEDPEVKRAREIFDSFKPEMKMALESASLDQVNKVLGNMKIDEAEELVNLFGEVSSSPSLTATFGHYSMTLQL
jgi:cell division cycle protein 37